MWRDLWDHEVRNEYSEKEAVVKGYRCRRVKGEFYPALLRSPLDDSEEQVEGKIYFDVNPNDFERVHHKTARHCGGTMYRLMFDSTFGPIHHFVKFS